MKNCKLKKIISWLLFVSMILGSTNFKLFADNFDGGSNSDGNNQFISSSFEFPSSKFFNYELKSDFYYNDDYFKNSATEYDDHMATMSLNFALTSFASYYYDVKERSANARELFGKIGFNNVTMNDDYNQEPRSNTMGVICANKHIYVKETSGVQDYNLIAVGMRSSNYKNEWASNLKMGATGDHTGFSEARDIAYNHVKSFYEDHKNDFGDIPTKFWIVGYSRGAACANMLGGKLTDEADDFNSSKDNIYVYTFATPQGANTSVHNNLSEYTNIHNIINPQDPVPKLAMSYLGFSRYGVDHFIPTYKNENLHDEAKASEARTNNQQYLNQKPQVEKYLKLLDPALEMTCEKFMVKDLTLMGKGGLMYLTNRGDKPFTPESKENDYFKQGEFCDYLMDFLARDVLNSNYPGTSFTSSGRQRYYDYYQELVMRVAEMFLKLDTNTFNEMIAKIKKNVSTAGMALLSAGMSIMNVVMNNQPRTQTIYDNVGNFLVSALTDVIEDDDLQFIKNNKNVLVDLFFDILVTDNKVANMTVSGSISGNNFVFLEGHGPEYLLSWLQYKDSYYTTPPVDTDYDDGYKSITLSNIENTTINIYVGNEVKGTIVADEHGDYVVTKDNDDIVFRMLKLENPVSYELQVGMAYDYTVEIIPSEDIIYTKFGYHEKFPQDSTGYRNMINIDDVHLKTSEKIIIDLTPEHITDLASTYLYSTIPAPRQAYYNKINIDGKQYGAGVDEFPYSKLPSIKKRIMINGKIVRADDETVELPTAGDFSGSYFITQNGEKENIDLTTDVYKDIDLIRDEKAFVVLKNNLSDGYGGVKTYNNYNEQTKTDTLMDYNKYNIYELSSLTINSINHVMTVAESNNLTGMNFGSANEESVVANEEIVEGEQSSGLFSEHGARLEDEENEEEFDVDIDYETNIATDSEIDSETVGSTEETVDASGAHEEETVAENEESVGANDETVGAKLGEPESEAEEEIEEANEDTEIFGFNGTSNSNTEKYVIAVPNGYATDASNNKIKYAEPGQNIKLIITDIKEGKKLTKIKIITENGSAIEKDATLNTPIDYEMTNENIYVQVVLEDLKYKITFDGDLYAKMYDEDDNELHSGVELPMDAEIYIKAPWFGGEDKKFLGWTLMSSSNKFLNDKELRSSVYINNSDIDYNIQSIKVPNFDIIIKANYINLTEADERELKKQVSFDNGQETIVKNHIIDNPVTLVARATKSDIPLQSFKITYDGSTYYVTPSSDIFIMDGYQYKAGTFRMPQTDVVAEAIYSNAPIPTPPTPPTPYNPTRPSYDGGGGGSDSSSSASVGFNTDLNSNHTWEGSGFIWKIKNKITNDYEKNVWLSLYYNGKKRWYYFGEDGVMKFGWLLYNNKIYYLQTDFNDTFGSMLTGIYKIDGKVYEFGPEGDLIREIQ